MRGLSYLLGISAGLGLALQVGMNAQLRKVMGSGKPKSIDEVVSALPGAGYVSKSPNLRVMVNQRLLSKPFKRVSRGVYCLGK